MFEIPTLLASLEIAEYDRKSSDSDERQAISIESQQTENASKLASLGLSLKLPPFAEEKTAKAPGRRVFTELMRLVDRGEVNAIVCWSLDRLSRNPIDNGTLEWYLGQGKLKAVITRDRIYTGSSDDQFMSALILAMGTKYIRDLSQNVKAKSRAYLAKGYWTGKPAVGYIRDPRYKDDTRFRDVLPDEERFHLIRDAFLMVLAGRNPGEVLDVLNKEWNFTTRRMKTFGGRRLSRSTFYRMLRDPFYTGLMRRAGETYQGRHTAMLTMEQFDQIQAILDGTGKPQGYKPNLLFPYRGLITCGACQAMVTAKNTTNRWGTQYRYYHCCRKNYRYEYCHEPAVEEAQIDEQLIAFISRLDLPARWLDVAAKKLGRLERAHVEAGAQREANLAVARSDVDAKLSRLDDLLIEGVLPADVYKAKRSALVAEQFRLGVGGPAEGHATLSVMKPFNDGISLLNSATEKLKSAQNDKKAVFVRQLVCNLQLTQKSLLIEAQFPFSMLARARDFPSLRRGEDLNLRYPFRYGTFPRCCTRPLCDLSIIFSYGIHIYRKR